MPFWSSGPWTRAVSYVLDALSPPACAACDAPSALQPFCPACGVPFAASRDAQVDGVPLVALGAYEAPLSTAVLRLKYGSRPDLSRPLARMLAAVLAERALPSDGVLVPVPLHPRRLATRGYNQAAILAQELARFAARECRPLLLRRVRETERQVGKSGAERRENPAGAFELRQRGAARVILVDDVVTTGSTVRACGQALRLGGIQLLAVVALAHADRR